MGGGGWTEPAPNRIVLIDVADLEVSQCRMFTEAVFSNVAPVNWQEMDPSFTCAARSTFKLNSFFVCSTSQIRKSACVKREWKTLTG